MPLSILSNAVLILFAGLLDIIKIEHADACIGNNVYSLWRTFYLPPLLGVTRALLFLLWIRNSLRTYTQY